MATPQIQIPPAQSFARLEAAVRQLHFENLDLKRRVSRFEAMERLQERGRRAGLPLAFRSQYGEDTLLWTLFADQADGFFIEIGAYDGVAFSVSHVFEAMGWRGLLVEAIPARCEQCAKNRPGSRVVHAALGARGSTGTASFTCVQGEGNLEMFSYLKPDPLHIERARKQGGSSSQVTVPLTTMDSLLADHPGPIDFAVIDVEGGELDLLDGFDLRRHRVRVLIIEDNLGGRDPKLAEYMAKLPYQQVAWVGVSRVYIRSDEGALLALARAAQGA